MKDFPPLAFVLESADHGFLDHLAHCPIGALALMMLAIGLLGMFMFRKTNDGER